MSADHEASRLHATATIMGTVVSVQLIGASETDAEVARGLDRCFAELRDVDRVFSTFRVDSDVSRVQRGELSLELADPRLAEVVAACGRAEIVTGGRFSTRWRGVFDPTGYVKGWAIEAAQRRHLLPLVARGHAVAAGLGAGGDMQLSTSASSDWVWQVGIADPTDASRLVATLELRDGAVATSGSAERGAHIIDPATGRAATGIASATVIADSLAEADVWATAAVVAGWEDQSWLAAARHTNGMLVADDGRVERWADGALLNSTG